MSDDAYNSFAGELARLKEASEWRAPHPLAERAGATVLLDGRRCVNLSSNDYLGLGSDETLLRSFLAETPAQLLDGRGMASSSARLLTGNHPAFGLLEQDLSALYAGRAACVFNSGYHANLGVCSALAGSRDAFFSDKLNHASLVDGMRLSGADLHRYRHLDLDHLEALLAKHRGQYRNAFIVTESVFSMDGDIPDLERLTRLKRDHKALLLVDEAHAVGVFGKQGLGVVADRGLLSETDLLIGTFGKALGSYGAFVVCDSILRDYLVNKARPFIFTTALPPAVVQWTRVALARAIGMDRERAHLLKLAGLLREALKAAGAETGGETQIVPVRVGESRKAVALARQLQAAGYLVFPIRPPTVPPGTARLRLSLSANLTWKQLCGLPREIKAVAV